MNNSEISEILTMVLIFMLVILFTLICVFVYLKLRSVKQEKQITGSENKKNI